MGRHTGALRAGRRAISGRLPRVPARSRRDRRGIVDILWRRDRDRRRRRSGRQPLLPRLLERGLLPPLLVLSGLELRSAVGGGAVGDDLGLETFRIGRFGRCFSFGFGGESKLLLWVRRSTTSFDAFVELGRRRVEEPSAFSHSQTYQRKPKRRTWT